MERDADEDRCDLLEHYNAAERMSLMRVLMRCMKCDCCSTTSSDNDDECSHWLKKAASLAILSLLLLFLLLSIIVISIRQMNHVTEHGNGLCAVSPYFDLGHCSPLY